MSETTDAPDLLLNRLADEFAARLRKGERPRLEEYCVRHPDLAEDIRSLFPALLELERAKLDAGLVLAVPDAFTPPVTRLGDFHLLRELGRGGMGVVYEAEQISLGRRVALKLLPSELFRDPIKRRRFEREAKAAAKLHHTNIVPVHGFGEHEGTPYYVMQFIPGLGLDAVVDELIRTSNSGRAPEAKRPLSVEHAALSATLARSIQGVDGAGALSQKEVLNDAPTRTSAGGAASKPNPPHRPDNCSSVSLSTSGIHLPGQSVSGVDGPKRKKTTYWESVARIGVQVAGALAYAHKLGVLHRDIKPSNLLLDLDGIVWVADFGLAKADDSDNLTHTGDLLGTFRYMPPEAFEGKSDTRSDIYALGLTLFELVALRPAYEERDRNKLIKQVTSGEPPRLWRLRKDAPRDLVTIIEKAIDREPARRYQTAGEIVDDLQRFLDGRSILARRTSTTEKLARWTKRNPVVAGAMGAVVLALAVGTTVSYVKYREAEQQKVIAENQQKESEKQAGIAIDREQEARKEAEKAKKAREFLISIFQITEKDVRGGNITARQILKDAERRIPVEFADQPELRGELLTAIGKVKRSIAQKVPQAMILEVRGPVELFSATGKSKAAIAQALVNLDDRLILSSNSQVQLVFMSDFHKERLKSGREVTIDVNGCNPADAVYERDNGILMTFVRLPKGTFYMGWDGDKKGVKTEIKEDFEIAAHYVTQGQWEAIMGNNPSDFSRKGSARGHVQDISDEELNFFPVENVSWDDTQEFIKKLNEKESGHGYKYRLPSEAEWEYACRNGATSEEECSHHFYFARPTDDLSSDLANFDGNFPFGKAPKGPFHSLPTRVGSYPPNILGLYDMHGNLWQWCDQDPKRGFDRPARGGNWGSKGFQCQASCCARIYPSYRDSSRGFRLVRVPFQPATDQRDLPVSGLRNRLPVFILGPRPAG